MLFLAGAYWINFLPEALALIVLTLPLVTVASRLWHSRRVQIEYGLLRQPFRRELRPYLLQCLNHWLLWALFAAAIMAGTFLTDVSKAWDMEAFAKRAEGFALKRGGEPHEIVGAALYLASDLSTYTTGSILTVDGGQP